MANKAIKDDADLGSSKNIDIGTSIRNVESALDGGSEDDEPTEVNQCYTELQEQGKCPPTNVMKSNTDKDDEVLIRTNEERFTGLQHDPWHDGANVNPKSALQNSIESMVDHVQQSKLKAIAKLEDVLEHVRPF